MQALRRRVKKKKPDVPTEVLPALHEVFQVEASTVASEAAGGWGRSRIVPGAWPNDVVKIA